MDHFADPVHDNGDQRQWNEDEEREHPVSCQHHDENEDECQDRVGWIHDARAEHIANGADIIRGVGHQVAGRFVLKIGVRQFLQVSQKVVAQIELDVP